VDDSISGALQLLVYCQKVKNNDHLNESWTVAVQSRTDQRCQFTK